MNREEFDKIIESNPKAKFKLVGSEGCVVFLDEGAVFTHYEDVESSKSAEFYCEAEDVHQTIWFCDIELITESVVQPLKLEFPCCIATSEIKDVETLKKVQDLFVASGATLEEIGSWNLPAYNYYGVDYDKEAWFWNDRDIYSLDENEEDVIVYTLKDLFPEVTEVTPEVVALTTPYEPFKVVKHTHYDVTIKGEEYRFTKEDANLLCTLLVEAIGEDYEPE